MNWKTVAIILAILVVLQALFIGYVFNIGNQMIEDEETCAYDVCGLDLYTTYDAYLVEEDRCYCFNDGEIVLTENLR